MRVARTSVWAAAVAVAAVGCRENTGRGTGTGTGAGGDGADGTGGPDEARPRATGGPPEEALRPGEADPILLQADLVTPDLEVAGGQVLFAKDRILCAGTGCTEGRFAAVAAGVPVIASPDRLVAFPGLIDIHNHISWNTWSRQRLDRDCYGNRDEWRNGDAAYDRFKGQQSGVSGAAYCEATLYGELRALVGGATVTQGATTKDYDDYKCVDTLVRNIDDFNGDLGGDHVAARISRVSSMDEDDARHLRDAFETGTTRSWLVHAGEGVDEYARSEFDALDRLGLVGPQLVVIHGTAFGQAELSRMGAAGAHLVMSPISNAMYYGGTADAVTARDLGVNLSIAPDWSPSGGESMLEELRWFDAYNRDVLQGAFSDEELVELATTNPARALKLEQQLGRLARNWRADLLVIRSDAPSPRRALLEASAEQVALVVVGGRIRYGDADLLRDVAGPECEPLDLCGVAKTICVNDPGRAAELGADFTWAGIEAKLRQVHPDLAPLATCGAQVPTPICQR